MERMAGEECIRSAEDLAGYRVKLPEGIAYRAMDMTPNEILERRAYLRRLLLNTPWGNSANEVLDRIRVRQIPDTGEILLSDEQECEFLLPSGRRDLKAGFFRKARSMVPFEFINKTVSDFEWGKYAGYDITTIRTFVSNYINEFESFQKRGMGIYIYSGTKGSGKTLLASIILNEISKRYAVNTKFATVLDFIEITKKGFNDSGEEVKKIYEAAVLVLDDLGVQMSKEWIESSLYQLLNYRYNNKLVTIYTSNIRYTDMKIDDRIVDRIDATSYLISIPEVPVRHKMKKAEKDKLMDEIMNKRAKS